VFRTLPETDPAEFAGKRALVTGGSRGIGAAIVQRLLDGGATVVTTARTHTDTTPANAVFITGDISTAAGVRALADETLAALGGEVDIVVNNAGAARAHLLGADQIPDSEWEDALALNYLSAVRVNNALLPVLRESGEAAIVNISSAAALVAVPGLTHYAAAKAALIAYSKNLATELAPARVRVNAVTPGNVLTPGADEIRQTFAHAMNVSPGDMTATVPLGRAGDPRDIAEMVAYLASARAQWITGSNFVVDGGEHPAAFG
jgi:NAD(P)-dependent dehydrogenase (short-subunit alcohol dehydrogenase family)